MFWLPQFGHFPTSIEDSLNSRKSDRFITCGRPLLLSLDETGKYSCVSFQLELAA
jgi:hypothetical protein